MTCPDCHQETPDTFVVCAFCGFDFEEVPPSPPSGAPAESAECIRDPRELSKEAQQAIEFRKQTKGMANSGA